MEKKEQVEPSGFEHIFSIKMKISIVNISKDNVYSDIEFIEWIEGKAIEFGVGRHCEYYASTENYEDDVRVIFDVCTV